MIKESPRPRVFTFCQIGSRLDYSLRRYVAWGHWSLLKLLGPLGQQSSSSGFQVVFKCLIGSDWVMECDSFDASCSTICDATGRGKCSTLPKGEDVMLNELK